MEVNRTGPMTSSRPLVLQCRTTRGDRPCWFPGEKCLGFVNHLVRVSHGALTETFVVAGRVSRYTRTNEILVNCEQGHEGPHHFLVNRTVVSSLFCFVFIDHAHPTKDDPQIARSVVRCRANINVHPKGNLQKHSQTTGIPVAVQESYWRLKNPTPAWSYI